MGRNCKSRYVQAAPAVKGFRPFGRLGGQRRTVVLSLDEYEAIRLLDYEHLTQEEAAIRMQISRPTLTRIYEKARVKYATALVEGSILLIEGGEVHFEQRMLHCRRCRSQFETTETEDANCPACHSELSETKIEINKNKCHKGRKCYQGGKHAKS